MKRAAYDPGDIRVYRGLGALIGEAANRARGVAAHARQLSEVSGIGRDYSVMISYYLLSELVKVCRPAVVAQAGPALADHGARRGGQHLY
jgi:hypothetical protein